MPGFKNIYLKIFNPSRPRITRINSGLFHKSTPEDSPLGRAQGLRADVSLGQCKPYCHSPPRPAAALTGADIRTYICYSKRDKVRARNQTPAHNYTYF